MLLYKCTSTKLIMCCLLLIDYVLQKSNSRPFIFKFCRENTTYLSHTFVHCSNKMLICFDVGCFPGNITELVSQFKFNKIQFWSFWHQAICDSHLALQSISNYSLSFEIVILEWPSKIIWIILICCRLSECINAKQFICTFVHQYISVINNMCSALQKKVSNNYFCSIDTCSNLCTIKID